MSDIVITTLLGGGSWTAAFVVLSTLILAAIRTHDWSPDLVSAMALVLALISYISGMYLATGALPPLNTTSVLQFITWLTIQQGVWAPIRKTWLGQFLEAIGNPPRQEQPVQEQSG